MMEDKTIEWDIVSATINESAGVTAGCIYDKHPDVIAATCWVFNHEMLLHVLARAKALLPNSLIALGGPEFLGDNEAFLRNAPFVNVIFRGEGEEAFPLWIKQISHPESWKSIPGLCYLQAANQQYQDNGTAKVKHFELLVPPEKSPYFNWGKPFVQLETTRGCFNTCAFCVSGGEKPVRSLSIEKIHERIDIIHSHGIRNIRVLDRTFNYNNKYAKELLNLFMQYPDTRFHLEIHPALLTNELKEILKQIPPGLLHLEAGIQSLKEKVIFTCQRKGSVQAALQGLQFLSTQSNLETHADLIAGLPYYNLDEIFADTRTLATCHAGEIQLESLKLLPGTRMREKAKELGISYSPLPPYEVLRTPDMSPDDLHTAFLLSRLLDGFYNTKAWQEFTRKLIIEQPDFLKLMLDFLISKGVADQPMSIERRGLLLYEFCQTHYRAYTTDATLAWIEAGMSLKKQPAERIRTKHITPPQKWNIVQGSYHTELKLCMLPSNENSPLTYWYGFDTENQNHKPVFKAIS